MNKHRNWSCAAALAALACLSPGAAFAQYVISTLVSSGTNTNYIDGIGVAVDAKGDVYLTGRYAPPNPFNAIFELPSGSSAPPIGVVGQDGPFGAFPGCQGAQPTLTQMSDLGGVGVDSSGADIYVAQSNNAPMLQVYGGIVHCLFSSQNLSATGIALDYSDNVYFPQQGVVYENNVPLASIGCAGGTATLRGVALDGFGNLYIADSGCNAIWKLTPPGRNAVAVAGIPGKSGFSGDGTATSVLLNQPNGVAVDPDGTNLYIADTVNDRIRKVTGGNMTTIAGTGAASDTGDNGPATSATLNAPSSLALAPGGAIYVSEGPPSLGTGGNRLRKLTLSAAQIFSPAPGSVLPGTAVTFEWRGGATGAQYELDVSDKINHIGGGDILGSATGGNPPNMTTGTSLTVQNLPCDGRPIYVQLATNGLDGWYRYTAYTGKTLELSVSPSQLPQQGGPLTLTAQVGNFSANTETVQLLRSGSLTVCRASTCTTAKIAFPTQTLTLAPCGSETVTYKRTIPALPIGDRATADFQASVTLGGKTLDTATATATQQ